MCSGGNGIQSETPRLAAIRCPSERCTVDISENTPGASVWKRLAGCSKRLGQRINGACLMYPICCTSASNGRSPIQIEDPGICTDPWPPRSSHRAYLDHSRLAVILSESWAWPTAKSKGEIASDATLDRSPGQCRLLTWHFPLLTSGSVSRCVTYMGGTYEATHSIAKGGWGVYIADISSHYRH